jgi:diguanylate cyclase (GGDEF)-like protein
MQEQRTDARWALNLPAVFLTRNWGRVPGVVKDFCAGGALLTFEEPEAASWAKPPDRGEGLVIQLRLEAGIKQLRGYVAHVGRGVIGVVFSDPPPEILEQLQRIARVPRLTMPVTDKVRRILLVLYTQAARYYQYSFGEFERRAEQDLIEAASNTQSQNEQRVLGDALKAFRQQRLLIRQRYHHTLQSGISQFDAGPLPPQRKDASDFALDDKTQFEEWLAMRVMVSRVESRCLGELRLLQTRLDSMTQAPPGRQFNPFACAFLCHSFQQALEAAGPSPAIEKVFYRAFEQTVLAGVHALYSDLNATLISHGVLPNLVPLPELSRIEQDGLKPTAIKPDPTIPLAALGAARAPARVIRTATELFAILDRPLPVHAAGSEVFRPLTATLGRLSLHLLDNNPGQPGLLLSNGDCEELLLGLGQADANRGWHERLVDAAAEHGRSLSPPALAASYVVDHLFAALFRQERLPADMAAELVRLQQPLLRMLLRDEDLLAREHSPVRQVVNTLVALGRDSATLAAADRALLSAAIERVAQAEPPTLAMFAVVLPGLRELQSRLELAWRMNLERLVRHAAGERRLMQARSRVQQELDARLAGHAVPQVALSLLDAGWQELLVNNLVRFHEDSDAWKNTWQVFDDLLQLARKPDRNVDWQELFGRIKAGLEPYAASHGALQGKALAELEELVLYIHSPATGKLATTRVPPKHGESLDETEMRWLEKWIDRARRLNRGDVVEVRHKGGESERLELAWMAEDHSRFVFADNHGEKLQDFTMRELVMLMRNGNAMLVGRQGLSPLDTATELLARELHEKIMWQASHDSTTGLPNQQEFGRVAEAAVYRAKSARAHHVLVMIAIDYFHELMQRMGKDAGDKLVQDLAHLLAKPLKSSATLARRGDDSFLLLLEDCELSEAQQLLSLRMGELGSTRFMVDGKQQRVSASAGLCDITYTSESYASVLLAAETACHEARNRGGQRIEIHRPDDAELQRRDGVMALVEKLNLALQNDRMQLRCQRIAPVDAARARQELPFYEVLLGMQDVAGEQLPPDVFVQTAERHNRMQAVDRWVIDNSFRWAADHPDKVANLGMISINLSGHSLNDMHLLEYIFERMAYWKVEPQKFCFEITETTAIANMADAADLMAELKKCGCRFALDDFGMGHLPSQFIKSLPVDYVKIDGTFVRELSGQGQDDLVVRSINEVAHVMRRQTIAEFVENTDILARLAEIGVDYAQGYGVERPRWLSSL